MNTATFATALLCSSPATALAASSTQSSTVSAPLTQQPLELAWEGGPVVRTQDRQLRFKLGGLVQADGRAFLGDTDDKIIDQFTLRRVRMTLEGTFYGLAELKIMPDFAGGQLVLQDAFIDLKFAPWLRFRVGKQKQPFGLERLQNPAQMTFLERAYPTQLAPNRDIGIIIHGEAAKRTVTWAAGVFNGVADGSSADVDVTDDKDLVGRLFLHPLALLESKWVSGLGLGVAASYGMTEGSLASPGLSSFRSAGQASFFTYTTGDDLSTTTIADGSVSRISPQAYYYGGPVAVVGEWVSASHALTLGDQKEEFTHHAYQVAASGVLTGEDATYKGVTPKTRFDVEKGTIGAIELGIRYAGVVFDERVVSSGFASSKSSTDSQAFAVVLNWYLNENTRLLFNFERTQFEGAERPVETLLAGRLQLAI